MTIKQKIEFAIEEWMKTKDHRKKKLVLLWTEDVPELADEILKEIKFAVHEKAEVVDGN